MNSPDIWVDDIGVRGQTTNGKAEQIAWNDLLEVAIRTTRAGPYFEDLFFVLKGPRDAGCVIPLSATKGNTFLERLRGLPGFDNGMVSQAMASTVSEEFVCWRR